MSVNIDHAAETAQFNNDLALLQHLMGRARPRQVWTDGVVVCEDCEVAIPAARLLAVPDCERCVDCQTYHEIREKQ